MSDISARPRFIPPFTSLKVRANAPRRDEIAAAQQKQEKIMPAAPQESTSQPATKVTTKHIRDLVIAHPGIKREEVYQVLVFSDGSNKKKVGDLISCLIAAKDLIQSNDDGQKILHPGARLNEVIEAPAAKPTEPQETKNIPAFLLKSAQAPARQSVDNTITDHLAAIAAIVPPGVVLGFCKGANGGMEITLDTKSGASFNVGENLEDAARCLRALTELQPFSEDLCV